MGNFSQGNDYLLAKKSKNNSVWLLDECNSYMSVFPTLMHECFPKLSCTSVFPYLNINNYREYTVFTITL